MRRVRFGNTQLYFPPVVFGTTIFGNLFVEHDSETTLNVTKAWFDHVATPVVVDTAGKYGAGLALETIGHNLRMCGVSPEDVIISNKLSWRRAPLVGDKPTFDPGIYVGLAHDAVQCISYDGMLECWEEGNRLLGAPYKAKLLAVHDPDEYVDNCASENERRQRMEDIRDAFRALQELKEKGEATAIGVGAMNWRTIKEIDSEIALDWVMIADSLTIYHHPPELLDLIESLHQRGVAVINSAVFHSGFLAGGDYFHYRLAARDNPQQREAFAWRDRFNALCEMHRVAPATACIQFALSHEGVCCVALNSSRPERIAQDVAAFEDTIPNAFWDELKAEGLIDRKYPYL